MKKTIILGIVATIMMLFTIQSALSAEHVAYTFDQANALLTNITLSTSFTANGSGNMTKIDLQVADNTSMAGYLALAIYTDGGVNHCAGTFIAGSENTIAGEDFTGTDVNTLSFLFNNTPIPLVNGTRYVVGMTGSTDGFGLSIPISNTNALTGENICYNNSGTWTKNVENDSMNITIYYFNETIPTPPVVPSTPTTNITYGESDVAPSIIDGIGKFFVGLASIALVAGIIVGVAVIAGQYKKFRKVK